MHDRQASSVCRVIGERDSGRLVVILQHRGIVLHFVDEGQLNSVAFELDGDAHFAAGIPTRDVSTTTSNTASRITRPCRGDRHTGRLGKPEPCTPAEKVRLTEHFALRHRSVKDAVGYFRMCKPRSFFRANVYLRPASVISF